MSDRLPIVLAHGITRFDILREIFVDKLGLAEEELGDRFHYFKGIKSHLEANGFEVHHSSVDFAGPVELRSRQLSGRMNEILTGEPFGKVHIIGHSMGGLDARHMIVDIDGMADRVASVTTIGTPHLGTSFADFGISHGGSVIDDLRSIIDLEGINDLTTTACEGFNARARDKEANNTVMYRTYASSEERDKVFFLLQPSWSLINEAEGENDGLVSVTSQLWDTELIASNGVRKQIEQLSFPIPADHLNEVGWWDPQETNPFLLLLRGGKQVEEYESKIRDIYLQMANSL
jgi:triacylglycerol lipase